MKKTILLLATLISMPVFAQEYTDYEFVGYQETQPFVDELTKYELLTLHKFYYQKEEPLTKVEAFDPKREEYDYCYPNPTLKEIISNTANLNYENDRLIILKSLEDYPVSKITIENVDSEPTTITDVIVKAYGQEIATINNSAKENTLSIAIPNISVDDLETIIYADRSRHNYLTVTFEGKTTSPINIIVNLEEEYSHSVIIPMSETRIAEIGLYDAKLQYHYRYTSVTYDCTNYERIYYDTLEADYLEGYNYDPIEDITLYKVYKRQLLPEQPNGEPKDDDYISDTKPSVPSIDEISQPSKPATPSIVPNKNINTNIMIDKNSPSNVDKDESTEDYSENSNLGPIAILDNEPYTNDKEDVNDGASTCTEYPEIVEHMRDIKLFLLILIILTILHTIQLLYVNKDN